MLAFKGLVKSLDIPPDCINDRDESHRITLNGNITYNLYLTDPKLPFITHNPNVIPRTLLTLKKHDGLVMLYLKVCPIYVINK